jgi:hypothetical protein
VRGTEVDDVARGVGGGVHRGDELVEEGEPAGHARNPEHVDDQSLFVDDHPQRLTAAHGEELRPGEHVDPDGAEELDPRDVDDHRAAARRERRVDRLGEPVDGTDVEFASQQDDLRLAQRDDVDPEERRADLVRRPPDAPGVLTARTRPRAA